MSLSVASPAGGSSLQGDAARVEVARAEAMKSFTLRNTQLTVGVAAPTERVLRLRQRAEVIRATGDLLEAVPGWRHAQISAEAVQCALGSEAAGGVQGGCHIHEAVSCVSTGCVGQVTPAGQLSGLQQGAPVRSAEHYLVYWAFRQRDV